MDLEKELQILKELTQEIEKGNNSKENLERFKELRKKVINSGKQELKLMIEETKRVKEEQKGQIQEKIRILEQTNPLTNQVKDKIDKLNHKLEQVDNLDDVLKKHVLEMTKKFKEYGITAEELGFKKLKENKKDIKTVEKLSSHVEGSPKVKEDIDNKGEQVIEKNERQGIDARIRLLNSIIGSDIKRKGKEIEEIEKQLEELGNGKKNIVIRIWDKIKQALGLNKSNKALASGNDIATDEQSWTDNMKVSVEPLSIEVLEEKAKKQLERQIGIGSIAKIDNTIVCYDIQKDISITKADIKDKEFKIDFIVLFDEEGNMEHCLNSGNIGKILTQKENLESLIKVHLLPVENEEEKDDIEYEEKEQDDDEGIWVLWNDVKDKFVDYILKQKETELGNI